jgi:hypothetical protein
VVNEDQDLGYPEHPPLNNLDNAHTPYHSETDFDHLRLDSPLADKPVDGLITRAALNNIWTWLTDRITTKLPPGDPSLAPEDIPLLLSTPSPPFQDPIPTPWTPEYKTDSDATPYTPGSFVASRSPSPDPGSSPKSVLIVSTSPRTPPPTYTRINPSTPIRSAIQGVTAGSIGGLDQTKQIGRQAHPKECICLNKNLCA